MKSDKREKSQKDASPKGGMEFAEKARLIRTLVGMTQQELADRLGIDRSAIARYENKGFIPRAEALCKYAVELRVPVGWLISNEQFYGVFRPLSPWKHPLTPVALDRVLHDLVNLLPKMAKEQGINRTVWVHCEIGSLLFFYGVYSWFLIICTVTVKQALLAIYPERDSGELKTNNELFADFYFNPGKALITHQYDIPAMCYNLSTLERNLGGLVGLYPPPSDAVRVKLAIRGIPENVDPGTIITALIEKAGYTVESMQVDEPEDPIENLPDEIADWIKKGNCKIKNGDLLKV